VRRRPGVVACLLLPACLGCASSSPQVHVDADRAGLLLEIVRHSGAVSVEARIDRNQRVFRMRLREPGRARAPTLPAGAHGSWTPAAVRAGLPLDAAEHSFPLGGYLQAPGTHPLDLVVTPHTETWSVVVRIARLGLDGALEVLHVLELDSTAPRPRDEPIRLPRAAFERSDGQGVLEGGSGLGYARRDTGTVVPAGSPPPD